MDAGAHTPRRARRALAGASIPSVRPRKKSGRLIDCQIMIATPARMIVTPSTNTSPTPKTDDPVP